MVDSILVIWNWQARGQLLPLSVAMGGASGGGGVRDGNNVMRQGCGRPRGRTRQMVTKFIPLRASESRAIIERTGCAV